MYGAWGPQTSPLTVGHTTSDEVQGNAFLQKIWKKRNGRNFLSNKCNREDVLELWEERSVAPFLIIVLVILPQMRFRGTHFFEIFEQNVMDGICQVTNVIVGPAWVVSNSISKILNSILNEYQTYQINISKLNEY